MHVRHEALFRRLLGIVPGSRLYGPYHHSGRDYFQWLVRGPALRRLLPLLDRHLSAELDGHALARFERMKRDYRLPDQRLPDWPDPSRRRPPERRSGDSRRRSQ
jgi:hypothetical protein